MRTFLKTLLAVAVMLVVAVLTHHLFGGVAAMAALPTAVKVYKPDGSYTFVPFGITGPITPTASGGVTQVGGTGAAAGGWDTAPHRDAVITEIEAIRTALVAAGIMS